MYSVYPFKQYDCLWCQKDMKYHQDLLHILINTDVICDECRMKLKSCYNRFMVQDLSCVGWYVYDGMVKDVLLQYKEFMDEALFPVFLYPYIQYIRKRYQGYTLVILPSSEKAYQRRGFSHVEKMFSVLGMHMISPFVKDNVEQKYRSVKEREYIDMHLVDSLPRTPLLLVDDMCTTGSTLLAAYNLVKNHPYKVEAMVCCYHAKYVEIRRWKKFVNCLFRIYTQVV